MRVFSFVFLVCTALAACGGDEDDGVDARLVGGACTIGGCEEQCVRGGDFPEGTCTIACGSDLGCPAGTHCVDREGGICLLACERPSDCRGGYSCKGRKNKGHGGDSLVCIGD